MKKLRYTRTVARSQEQPEPLETSIFAEQQAQAKQGVITSPSGADAVIRALGDASPVTNTLGGLARDACAAAVADKIVIVNFAARTVTITGTGDDISDVEGAGTLASIVTPDDPTKASGPMTATTIVTDGNADIRDIVAAAKPSLSVESFLNRLEDAVLNPDGDFVGNAKSAIAVVNQTAKTIKVYQADAADLEALDVAGVTAEDAHFAQTLVSSTGRQFGE